MEGRADFDGYETWYRVEGELRADGPAPVVLLHGGPGGNSHYLEPMVDLGRDGRAVVFYDQLGCGNSTHLPDRGADFWTVDLYVRQLAALIEHLGIGDRYHVLGQSWGGILAQEHAFTQPTGLRSLVLSNTAASYGDFVDAATALRADLPPEVEATLQRHEDAGTTDHPDYQRACQVFYDRHVCRLQPWPEEVTRSFAVVDEEPTVYRVMNGPSEFHVVGTMRDWQAKDRLHLIRTPTLVVGGRYDEAAPAVQEPLVSGIAEAEQVIFEDSSHMPFWEEREAYMATVDSWLARYD